MKNIIIDIITYIILFNVGMMLICAGIAAFREWYWKEQEKKENKRDE